MISYDIRLYNSCPSLSADHNAALRVQTPSKVLLCDIM